MPDGASYRFDPTDSPGNLSDANLNSLDDGGNVSRTPGQLLQVEVSALRYWKGSTVDIEIIDYAGATGQAVAPSTTNYVYLNAAGSLVIDAIGFPAAPTQSIPLAEVVTSLTTITSITDKRPKIAMKGSAVADAASVFIPVDWSGNFGDLRTRSAATNGSIRLTFRVPGDFGSLDNFYVVGVPGSGVPGAGKDIDLFSDYGAIGEAFNQHDESDTTITFDLTGTLDEYTRLDVSSVFSSLSAEDFGGVLVDHNAIGGSIDYLGIEIHYQRV